MHLIAWKNRSTQEELYLHVHPSSPTLGFHWAPAREGALAFADPAHAEWFRVGVVQPKINCTSVVPAEG